MTMTLREALNTSQDTDWLIGTIIIQDGDCEYPSDRRAFILRIPGTVTAVDAGGDIMIVAEDFDAWTVHPELPKVNLDGILRK